MNVTTASINAQRLIKADINIGIILCVIFIKLCTAIYTNTVLISNVHTMIIFTCPISIWLVLYQMSIYNIL